MTSFGWSLENDTLNIIWDSQENMDQIQKNVTSLLKGCRCVTGCSSRRCSCVKGNNSCSPGCECKNCCNLQTTTEINPTDSELNDIAIEEEITATNCTEVDDMMDWIFSVSAETSDETEFHIVLSPMEPVDTV